MDVNIKEIFKTEDIEADYAKSYAPIIVELTPRQLKQKRVMRRFKYFLKILNYLLLIGVGLTFLYPFLWMLVMSLRDLTEAIAFKPGLGFENGIHWSNYVEAWERARFSLYLGNSITYAVLVLSLQYIFIVPAAYAFARMKFKGNKALFAIKQLGMMLPAEATLIPIYFFYSKMGLIDTWTGLILPSLFNMFGIYLFTNHFKTVQPEIIEAATMDKAKNRTIMLRIMVPIIFPVFVTHFLLTFISNWNSYYWVLVMTNSEALKTLPVAVRGLLKADGIVPPWHLVMAGNVMQLAPIFLMYIFGSRSMKRAMIGGRKLNYAGGTKDPLFKRIFKGIGKLFKKTSEKTAIKER